VGEDRPVSAPDGVASQVTPLGIGLPYMAGLPADLYRSSVVDFVEVTVETLSRPRQQGTSVAIDLVTDKLAYARDTCGALPIVVHGVELSIGSAAGWNEAYLDLLDDFQQRWPFLWHSEHLGFQTMADHHGKIVEIGVPLPLPPTEQAAALVTARSRSIRERYGVPFLLENPAHYLGHLPADATIGDDIGLMRAILAGSGCGQLLDLHNVYCNAVNHRFNAFDAIDRMPLERAVELHVAGGSWHDGFWTDAHDSRVPESVWELLEYTLPRAPNVKGVVFEMLEPHAVRLGPEVIEAELSRAQSIWKCCRAGRP